MFGTASVVCAALRSDGTAWGTDSGIRGTCQSWNCLGHRLWLLVVDLCFARHGWWLRVRCFCRLCCSGNRCTCQRWDCLGHFLWLLVVDLCFAGPFVLQWAPKHLPKLGLPGALTLASGCCGSLLEVAGLVAASAWGTDSGIWMFWIFALRCRVVAACSALLLSSVTRLAPMHLANLALLRALRLASVGAVGRVAACSLPNLALLGPLTPASGCCGSLLWASGLVVAWSLLLPLVLGEAPLHLPKLGLLGPLTLDSGCCGSLLGAQGLLLVALRLASAVVLDGMLVFAQEVVLARRH